MKTLTCNTGELDGVLNMLQDICDAAQAPGGTLEEQARALFAAIQSQKFVATLTERDQVIVRYEKMITELMIKAATHPTRADAVTWEEVDYAFGNAMGADKDALKQAWRNVK